MKLAAYIRLTRPPNGLLMFFAVVVGIVFSSEKTASLHQIFYALFTSYGLTAASMALNDYFDRDVDRVNNPSRPIPSGAVSPRSALAASFFMAAVGLVAAILTSIQCFAMALTAYAVAVVYNWRLKKTGLPGNLAVSFTVVAPFLYGSILADGYVSGRVFVFAALAFLANTGREVIKGMTDVEGDEKRDVLTVARKHGLTTAAWLGSSLYFSAVALSPLPYLLGIAGLLYMFSVTAADLGFLYSGLKLVANPVAEEAWRQKNLTLVWMFLALLSFLAGGLT
ncbi:MAG: geranylgeranylglycerol-phosphate geranylgeranyltransferase [Candidatus Caldarchaeum sp.]|uniref:Geranylgeranylglycerol-phosphate geranylgeranyltransferase n=1 Tax=Caldiarchaeum subterraneum TaxID=311458 RepID=A0A7C5QA51_CALS0